MGELFTDEWLESALGWTSNRVSDNKKPCSRWVRAGFIENIFRELRATALPARRVFRCAILNSLTVTQPSPMLSATTHLRTLTQNRDNERCGGEAGK